MLKVNCKLIACIFQKDTPTPLGLQHFSKHLQKSQEESSSKNAESKHKQNHLSYLPAPVCNNGIQKKKLVHVHQKLGHKSIITTTIYTHLINFETETHHSKVARIVEEARKIVEAGFEFVCDMDSYKLFRKAK